MELFGRRVGSVWRRAAGLGWPVAVQHTFTTLMRTVDIIVTGLFSPAAVAAVGLADLYAQLPLRVGLGLGAGAITLSSQDTGRDAEVSRDRAITLALVIGALCGLPLVAVGLFHGRPLIALLGAEREVARLGGLYLTLVFGVAPMRIVGLVGARALQGAGDTRTPMVLNGGVNLVNAGLTVALGLGIWQFPRMGIVGVGLATAISRTIEAALVTAAIATPRTALSLEPTWDTTVARQVVSVSLPSFAEGMSTSIANFPFNSLLLLFGTEANAAYHIGRRVYQQLTGPLYRSASTVTSIIVGQALGEGKAAEARRDAVSLLVLSFALLTAAGAVMFLGAERIVAVFTNDPATRRHAVAFTRVFAVSMPFFGVFFPLAGALRGAGDTRTPFYARLAGTFVFLLGASYVLAVPLGYGLVGVYVGMVLSYACWAVIVAAGFYWGGWADTAASMIAEREEESEPEGE
ncbi:MULTISPECIES: MATE family efflux transporter [Halolamina]|uniref:Multidrug-efflux transporter n=1 Tax=Halolamina pelagica TaxID=699431 RepID=A0A1I5R9D4_9EURY|nr:MULTISPECIES: MATE family efflux transporter [Halolamina]NHX35752.1 MATE family efflux transporter [Halolamina sp. R1-12]SFP55142.1 putative efflux protein, MATE family [Halolamina pelagica]